MLTQENDSCTRIQSGLIRTPPHWRRWRRRSGSTPRSGLQETRSAAAQAAYLREAGFQRAAWATPACPRPSSRPMAQGKPIIGFLGEYDCLAGAVAGSRALPQAAAARAGRATAAGTTCWASAAWRAAVALKREIEAGHGQGHGALLWLPGRGDSASGKVFMAKHGLFDDLDAALTWHPMHLNTARCGSNLANQLGALRLPRSHRARRRLTRTWASAPSTPSS